ncbi:EAL domain-containing protein [Actinopolyspora sp. H202]|uniref:EAL domain-containing protein n=1 Tax=Actinopolyspora sp. H202 TaxID=1500456 RepID=UPI003EE43188
MRRVLQMNGDTLFQTLPTAMAVLDESEHVVAVNEALCALLGRTSEDLVQHSSVELLSQQDRSNTLTARHGDIGADHGGLTRHQRRLQCAEGETVFCDVHATFLPNEGRSGVWLVAFIDVRQRHHYTQALHAETEHDELTGLLNRKGVRRLLDQQLSAERRPDCAVLFCDLDNFKRINDTLGHKVGDDLLIRLAQRLRQGLPPECVPARHSGDEFLIICPEMTAQGGVQELAETVAVLLRTSLPQEDCLIAVSASIGIATTTNPGAQRTEDLLRLAEVAMYRAKDRGTGHVVRADTESSTSLEHEADFEQDLRQALSRDELALHYQPIVNPTGHVHSAEALLRWPHPRHGLLSPGVILPAAHNAQLMAELDRWVLRTAAREAATWPTQQGKPVAVTVNLSSTLLHEPDFADHIERIVPEAGLEWHRLVLEITETDLLDLAPATLTAMHELAERGVRFALDDFGTGYSSLERLKELPVQILKLDRTFAAALEHDPVDAAIAGAALSIAQARNMTCVAEGVETTGQLYQLARIGFTDYQGFLFAAGLPASHLRALIQHPPTLAGRKQRGEHPLPSGAAPAAPDAPGAATLTPDTTPPSRRTAGEVAAVDEPLPGGHECWIFQNHEEFRTRAREYVRDGLRHGYWIEYVDHAPAAQLRTQLDADDLLGPAIATGAMTVATIDEFYPTNAEGVVDAEAAMRARVTAAEKALAAGYTGFRAIVNATAMVTTPEQRAAFAYYEYLCDHVISTEPVTALCAYNLTELGSAAVTEMGCLHPVTSPAASPFRLYTDNTDNTDNEYDTHLALTGRLDPPCANLFTSALEHTRAHNLLINDRGLDILDPRVIQALDQYARLHHKNVTLRLTPPLSTRLQPHLRNLTHTRIETHPA